MLTKIDVEGLECRGIEKTLRDYSAAVITECARAHLERADSSVEELFGFTQDHGYAGYHIGEHRRRLRRPRLTLELVDSVPMSTWDKFSETILWLLPDGPFAEVVSPKR